MSNIRPYEDAALSGELNEEEQERVIDAFTEWSDINHVAQKLDLPRDLVRRVLRDPNVIRKALQAKQIAAGLMFLGNVFDELNKMIIDTTETTASRIKAIREMKDLLGLKTVADPDAPNKGGATEININLYEAALAASREKNVTPDG